MRVSTILFAVAVLILVISLLCVWFYHSEQDFMESNIDWNGIKSFSGDFNADNIDTLDNLPDLPEEAVLVAIPYLEYNDEELAKMKQFVDDGGTLLLMDDYGYGNSVLAYLGVGVRFTNEPLLDPLFYYKNPSMPTITDFAPQVEEGGIGIIMLNHATTLTDAVQSEAIAWSSSSSFLDINGNGVWDEGEPVGPFVVAATSQVGKGTLALVSDPSIAINAMLDRDDNYDFIQYLTRYKDEQTKLMVERSHLPKAPLDVSKARLLKTREVLANPYALLGITAMVFVVVSRYTIRKGRNIG